MFFSLTSLLGLDRTTRKSSFKRLFRSERTMVVSDYSPTFAQRVLYDLREVHTVSLGLFVEPMRGGQRLQCTLTSTHQCIIFCTCVLP